MFKFNSAKYLIIVGILMDLWWTVNETGVFGLMFTDRHFWNRKCRKKTWWQQEFAVFKCEATANSVTGHVCVYSNTFGTESAVRKRGGSRNLQNCPKYHYICLVT